MIKQIFGLASVVAALTAGTILAPSFELNVGVKQSAAEVQVKARDLSLVCPGGVYQSGGSSGTKLGSFVQIGSPLISSAYSQAGSTELVSIDGVYTVKDSTGDAQQGSTLLNVNQIQLANTSTISGLAAAACQRPSSEMWINGGDTTTGHEALLILRNAGATDATVDLEIFSEGGSVDAPGLKGIAVSAGQSIVLPLAGLIPKTATFTTHISAHGGAIAAWVQQRVVHGLAAAGVDFISPSPDASVDAVVPGVFIRGSALVTKLVKSDASYGDLRPTLRIFVPGTKPATFTAQIMGATADTFGTVIHEEVPGGTVVDFKLTGLVDGDYVALINSDQPVIASVRLSRVVASRTPDFTWLSAAEGFNNARMISIPAPGISKICIYDKTTGKVSVEKLTGGSDYGFTAGDSVRYATVIVDVDGAVANIPVLDQKNAGGKVSVTVR